jgi:MFS family permease
MMLAGPLSDKIGRRAVLRYASVLYAISALGSAYAPDFFWFVIARMIGGLGVGASLILAPMYIAEISPPHLRGRMVSFNQLNIVVGISLAFFTNYLILQLGKSDASWAINLKLHEHNWRWMLGIETLPAVLYFIGLFSVPRSPRWLIMQGEAKEALHIMSRFTDKLQAKEQLETINESLGQKEEKSGLKDLLNPAFKFVLTIGIVIAVLQQITGINAVFFYAPMIFKLSGLATEDALFQPILIGLTNLVFTILAILFIDKLGRKPLLLIGVTGIALSLFSLSLGFHNATFKLNSTELASFTTNTHQEALKPLIGQEFKSQDSFESAVISTIGKEDYANFKDQFINTSIQMNSTQILVSLLFFVASFAISIGPVMWVLFSELFPNKIRGIAISFVGLINSLTSFIVQLVFPWELDVLGSSTTFLIYGVFTLLGLAFIIKVVPETKGKSLEELEAQLVK